MKIGKILKTVVAKAKANPEIALAAAGLIAPKLVAKAAPVIVAVIAKPKA